MQRPDPGRRARLSNVGSTTNYVNNGVAGVGPSGVWHVERLLAAKAKCAACVKPSGQSSPGVVDTAVVVGLLDHHPELVVVAWV